MTWILDKIKDRRFQDVPILLDYPTCPIMIDKLRGNSKNIIRIKFTILG